MQATSSTSSHSQHQRGVDEDATVASDVPSTRDRDQQVTDTTRPPHRARLHASFQDDRTYLPKMIALDHTTGSTRVAAVLTLKHSLEQSAATIQSRNALAARHQRERDDHDAARFDELQSQGLNPYEVTRTRAVREAATAERQAIERRIQQQQESILTHLEVEKIWKARQDKVAAAQRAYDATYQKEMGRAAVEQRTAAYLASRTGGRETVDPTGKAVRVYPSQETTIKDRSFGLGRNLVHDAAQRHRIVDKVHRKRAHRNDPSAVPSASLLPKYGESSDGNGDGNGSGDHRDEDETNASRSVAAPVVAARVPGQDLAPLNHALLDTDGTHGTDGSRALPPVARTAGAPAAPGATPPPATTKKGFGKPHRSVLEQQLLAQARVRQQTNLVQKQIVWGKEFTGTAFLADPSSLWFQDFEVGVPMTRTVTLTNVSHTFNHFKLLALDDAVCEFFEITYERPGRMSAGMACRITITFTAIQARDLETQLPALAQTGPFALPLRCTCKKAVPVLPVPHALVFEHVVAGETSALTLTLENQGALPLAFCVRRVPSQLQVVESVGEEATRPETEERGDETSDLLLSRVETTDASLRPTTASEVDDHDTAVEAPHRVDGDTDGTDDQAVAVDDANDDDLTAAGEAEDGTVSSSASRTSLHSNATTATTATPSLDAQRVPLSPDELAILERARAATVFHPEGADTPLRHTRAGTVAPYGSAAVTFTFAPAAPMVLDHECFVITFPQAETTYRTAPWAVELLAPIAVTVTARATPVPVFVAQHELDLRCCLYDRLYRQQLVVRNRGSVALKMQLRVPKALDGCVEFHPNMGFVQGASTGGSASASASASAQADGTAGAFPVQIKFRPHADMWPRLEAAGFGSRALGFFAVPVQVVVPDQVVPVYFLLHARLASAALLLLPTRLDFGACALGHSVVHVLQLTNTSRVPQRVAFVQLPPELRLECTGDDDVTTTLLPFDTKAVRVVYTPTASATTLATRLLCRSTLNETYAVRVTGECVATPLVFSHTVVQLAATQLGQMQTYSLTCTNPSDVSQTMELVVPPEAKDALRVTPTVVTIDARASVRVELQFTASDALFEVRDAAYPTANETPEKTTASAHSVRVNASHRDGTRIPPTVSHVLRNLPMAQRPEWVETNGVPAEDRSVHHEWTVLCFRQPTTSTATATSSAPAVVAFQVRTTVVDALVVAAPSELDFGQVAIGQTRVRALTLTNHSALDVLLRARPLHVLGGFRVIHSLQRTLACGGGTRTVHIEFQPQSPLLYDDELELACATRGVVRVALRGEGVNPSLRVQPENGVLDFKDVLARNRSTMELQLTNASGFPLPLAMVPLTEADAGAAMPVTSSGLPVFTFSPSEATIPAHATLTVRVVFFPDHERPQHYAQQFLIQVPNASERHVVSLAGRCWENQLYVFNPQAPLALVAAPSVDDVFDVPPTVNLSSLFGASNMNTGLLSAALAVPGIKRAPAPLTVVFDGDASLPCETKTILIGATLPLTTDDESGGSAPKAPAAGGASVGSFEWTIDEHGEKPQYAKLFTLEPTKGTLTAAQQLPVHITYQQRSATDATAVDGDAIASHPELVVAQWIQVRVTCTLKGGVLWRALPSTAPTAAGTAGKTAPSAAAAGAESDVRVVHVVLRAKMLS